MKTSVEHEIELNGRFSCRILVFSNSPFINYDFANCKKAPDNNVMKNAIIHRFLSLSWSINNMYMFRRFDIE